MPPGIQPVGVEAQFLGNHFSGLAAGKPVLDGFTFERFVEFTAGVGGCLGHGLDGSLITQSSVRQFETALHYQKRSESERKEMLRP